MQSLDDISAQMQMVATLFRADMKIGVLRRFCSLLSIVNIWGEFQYFRCLCSVGDVSNILI